MSTHFNQKNWREGKKKATQFLNIDSKENNYIVNGVTNPYFLNNIIQMMIIYCHNLKNLT
jgi:hypothetical protein